MTSNYINIYIYIYIHRDKYMGIWGRVGRGEERIREDLKWDKMGRESI